MKATILCIGDEVLCGDVLNSNGTFFAKELTEIGIEVVKHVVVSDDEDMVEGAFNDAVNISDYYYRRAWSYTRRYDKRGNS